MRTLRRNQFKRTKSQTETSKLLIDYESGKVVCCWFVDVLIISLRKPYLVVTVSGFFRPRRPARRIGWYLISA
jgi:hypothetical protein